MSDTPGHGPVNYIMPKWIRVLRIFLAGLC